MPFFSVIIPTYNRASIVTRAINSVLSQTFDNFEIIVVDDGSTDATKGIVLSLKDTRIRYIYQENRGVCAARNNGTSNAQGEYFVFLDSDDYTLPNWLNDFYEACTTNSTDFVFCDMNRVDVVMKKETIIKALDPYSMGVVMKSGLYMPGTFCVKSSFYYKTRGFDVNLKYGEFTEFSMNSSQLNPTKFFIEKVGLVYEVSISGGSKNSQNKIDSNLLIIQKHPWFFKKHPHVLRLYYQNIGVAYSQLLNFRAARNFFWKAYWIKPLKFETLFRFLISFFPKCAKKVIR